MTPWSLNRRTLDWKAGGSDRRIGCRRADRIPAVEAVVNRSDATPMQAVVFFHDRSLRTFAGAKAEETPPGKILVGKSPNVFTIPGGVHLIHPATSAG